VLLMTFIGGAGVFFGPIIGAAIITFMQSMLSDFTKVWQLYLGLLFVVMVLFAPFGIGGMVARMLLAVKRGELAEKLPGWLLGAFGALTAFFGAVMAIEMAYRIREGGRPFRAFGSDFVHTSLLNWLFAAVIMAVGIAIVAVAVRWRRRGSLGAALRFREAAP
jgi:branched-chain amino acid transport system permease protein